MFIDPEQKQQPRGCHPAEVTKVKQTKVCHAGCIWQGGWHSSF
jgi:hypothetical protein